MWMVEFVSPFKARIAATVVLNLFAMRLNVSPFLTVYVPCTDGAGAVEGDADGSDDGLIDTDDVGVAASEGRSVATEGVAEAATGRGLEPPDMRLSPTTTKATIIRPTSASWPGVRSSCRRVAWSTSRGDSSSTGAVRGIPRLAASAAAISPGSTPGARFATREARAET